MKNLVCLPKSFIAGALLLLTACVKEPSPNTPIPSKPEWLLTKVVALERRGEPEGGPVFYSAIVDEYQYNRQHKPWLHIEYNGTDTNNLQRGNVDTLFYDKQLRPVRVSSSERYIYRNERKFYYKGDERLPDREESIYIDSSGMVSAIGTTRYLYNDTMIYMLDERAHQDTFGYVYNRQGNCIGIYFGSSGVQPVYEVYDNAVNVSRFLNLDYGRVMNVREADTGPLLSKNNWTSVPSESLDRTITYDAQGRVATSFIRYSFPTRDVTTYYHYTLVR